MRTSQLFFNALLVVIFCASYSMAGDKTWAEKHPRQAEVNGRLKNQKKRVNAGVANGSLTAAQGKQIKHEDKAIYREEQRMKARNGGNYITKAQQNKLNRQENAVSNQIKTDEQH